MSVLTFGLSLIMSGEMCVSAYLVKDYGGDEIMTTRTPTSNFDSLLTDFEENNKYFCVHWTS